MNKYFEDGAKFVLSYEGALAEEHLLDMYSASRAVEGFQRSLALTAHLVVNDEIITKSTAIKNVQVFVAPPKEGSWELVAIVVSTLFLSATQSKDSPFGHVMHSVYSGLMNRMLGIEVDYEKTIQQSLHERKTLQGGSIDDARLDSLAEKVEGSVLGMHMPIIRESAVQGEVYAKPKSGNRFKIAYVNGSTYDGLATKEISDSPKKLIARVTSFNSKTNHGRLVSEAYGSRTVAFDLVDAAKNKLTQIQAVRSLASYVVEDPTKGLVMVTAYEEQTKVGRLKRLIVSNIAQL